MVRNTTNSLYKREYKTISTHRGSNQRELTKWSLTSLKGQMRSTREKISPWD